MFTSTKLSIGLEGYIETTNFPKIFRLPVTFDLDTAVTLRLHSTCTRSAQRGPAYSTNGSLCKQSVMWLDLFLWQIICDSQFGLVLVCRIAREEFYIICTEIIVIIFTEQYTELGHAVLVDEGQV